MAEQSAQPVHVIDSSGVLGTVPADQAESAISVGGFRLAKPEEIQAASDKETYGKGTGSALKAAGLGAARSASFGLSDEFLVNSGAMKPEEISAYKKYRPGFTTAGEIAGVAGAALAPETGALGVLSAPVKAVSELGGGITEALAPAASSGIVGKVLGQAGAHAAGSAVEGAAYGLGQTVTEHALGDPDLNGEKVMANLGTGALFGGALGGMFGAAKEVVPAVIEKAGLTTENLGKILSKTSSTLSGTAQSDIDPLLAGIGTEEGAAMRKTSLEGYADREKTARELADGLADQHSAMDKAKNEYYKGARQEEISKLMSEVPQETAFNAAANEAGNLRAAIKEMRNEPEIYAAPGKVRRLEIISEGLEKKITNSSTSEEIYHAMNDAKQQMDPLAKFDGIPNATERDTINKIKEVRSGFKTHLEDPAVYGEAGARQGALNSAYSEFAPASRDFLKAFGKKLSNGEMKIDPGKVNTFLGQMGRPGADIKQQILADYLEASQGLAKQMAESSINAETKVDTNKLMDLFQKTHGIAEGAESELESVNQLKRLKKFGDNASSIGAGAIIGAAAHAAGVSNPIIGAAEAAYGVYHTLKHPAEMIRILSSVERAAMKVSKTIESGSSAIFKVSETGSALQGYAAAHFPSKEDRKNNHDKMRPELSEMTANPEKLIDHLSKGTESLSHIAPGVAASVQGSAARATQFLQSKLPGNNIPKKPLSPEYQPSHSELSKWHKYFSAVEYPTDALKDVSRGTLVPETMETLAVVYPKLLKEMQLAVTDKMTDAIAKKKEIPYRTKLMLSMFLGSDLVNSLDPKSMLATQNTMATATAMRNAQESQQMNSVNKKSTGKIEKSNRLLTAFQANSQRQET